MHRLKGSARITKCLVLIFLGVSMMFALFGCGKPKYKLRFDGYGFQSSKTAYAAGEKVTVYFELIATDTDYRFWLDDESVKLNQDYSERRGYVFTFLMPEHDLTLHVSSRNSMEYIPSISVTFQNEVEEADVWVLPQTEENRKSSLWGTPSAEKLGPGESVELSLTQAQNAEAWLIRIIDDEKAFYSAQDLKLEDGFALIFKSEGSKFDAVIEVQDQNGTVVYTAEAFTGVLGAE